MLKKRRVQGEGGQRHKIATGKSVPIKEQKRGGNRAVSALL